ncbi:MAG: hypothetical protein JO197_00620 [Acidobacteria bacterium]|nr:hypothetical protein [Acidobacteriota bacterium]MBV9476383.1 hypothetical protein [Acidobacteriota bacterium]
MALFAVPMSADVCVRCVARNCVVDVPGGYVQCMSNGRECIYWQDCIGTTVAVPDVPLKGEPPLRPQWRVASVDVIPAPRQRALRWQLAASTFAGTSFAHR